MNQPFTQNRWQTPASVVKTAYLSGRPSPLLFMLRDLFTFLGRLYRLVASLVLIAILAVAAWLLGYFYQEEHTQNRFLREGRPIEVRLATAELEQRSWRDAFGNVAYVTFPYHQKTYMTRYVMDTAWVGSGDRVRLLYHPELDEFRQQHAEPKPDRSTSRLIRWSSASDFSTENKLLAGLLVVITSLFFFAGGFIVSLTGWTFLQSVARLVLVVVLFGVAVFFSYDAVEYFRYYGKLKASGQPMDVPVLKTDRHRVGRSTRSTVFKSYTYQATCRFPQGERTIPITEDDYETVKPTDRLAVLYNAGQDDAMSATYPGDYWTLVVPVFFWLLFGVVGWKTFLKRVDK
ncbi:hypothetical protein ACO2Q8_24765 [Larkinella sp. VNQ87]|uniref:hypothetical protein n=1 Tax=Larkinella sp. VNQ87 TaxID=3400921 RepID=UPI003BFED359